MKSRKQGQRKRIQPVSNGLGEGPTERNRSPREEEEEKVCSRCFVVGRSIDAGSGVADWEISNPAPIIKHL